ncbi:FliH/SctL family protein [Legionella rowbothamii]|uniref:FliH/SctL family protein n=1 Tax=Legionella rowbothamii TaxID=96229 RepID=UPI001054C4BC|nr:FliH/SctL family protein [Legionella rowbothamii]
MATLHKNVLVSTEVIYLNQEAPELIDTVPPETPTVDESQCELIRQEAYEQGYLAGMTEEQARLGQEKSQNQQQLEQMLASLPQAVAQNRLDLANEIADIVLLISKQFFVENSNNQQALSQQINHILTQLNDKQSVELYLHPQDIVALQNGTMQLSAAHLNGLKIKTDESLALGGYVLKTNHGIFDASIEKQIDKLKEVLLQLKQRGAHASMD